LSYYESLYLMVRRNNPKAR